MRVLTIRDRPRRTGATHFCKQSVSDLQGGGMRCLIVGSATPSASDVGVGVLGRSNRYRYNVDGFAFSLAARCLCWRQPDAGENNTIYR
jgi:hypothetical protein